MEGGGSVPLSAMSPPYGPYGSGGRVDPDGSLLPLGNAWTRERMFRPEPQGREGAGWLVRRDTVMGHPAVRKLL